MFFWYPILDPKNLQNGAKIEPTLRLRGAKMEVEIRKKREKLEAYAQDRSKGGLGTFCHGFGNVLGRF